MENTTNIEPGQLGSAQLAAEQAYVSMLYDRLDEARARTVAALRTEHARHTGTRQALVEREVAADEHVRRLAQLTGSERALCFGRIDAPEALYIGRIGVRSTGGDVVLVGGRGPPAPPACAAAPRHTRSRRARP